MDEFVAGDPGRSAWISGRDEVVAVAERVERPGASVHKLFVAVAVALVANRGDLDLDETVAVRELPPSAYPSITCALAPSHRLSIAEMAGLMMATSDNRIAEHLVERLAPGPITRELRAIGCADTVVDVGYSDEHLGPSGRVNVTTVRDCATALGAIVAEPLYSWLRPAMRSSLFNTRILASLPDDVVVSHKTGSLEGVVNDVGIVHAPGGDLVVCFLSDRQPDATDTSAAIARCARTVLDAAMDHDAATAGPRPVS